MWVGRSESPSSIIAVGVRMMRMREERPPQKQDDNNLKSALGATIQGVFFTVPPNFWYQNEKQVSANQSYFLKEIFKLKDLLVG